MGHIVVGVDGSESGRHALALALDLASQSDDMIDVIHAWERPLVVGYASSGRSRDDPEQAARKLIASEIAFALRRHGNRQLSKERVRPKVIEGRPSAVLIQASKDATLLAIGSSRTTSLDVPKLGSVSLEVVRHAWCPVLVVPPVHVADLGSSSDGRELVDCVG